MLLNIEFGGLAGRLDHHVAVVQQVGERPRHYVHDIADPADESLHGLFAQPERQALYMINALVVQFIQVVAPIFPIPYRPAGTNGESSQYKPASVRPANPAGS